MKKIFTSILALTLIFAVAPSCEKEQPAPEDKPITEQPDPDPKPEPEPEPEPEPDKPVVTWSVNVSVENVADGLISWEEALIHNFMWWL